MRLAPSPDEIRARLGDAWPVPGAADCHAHVFEPGFPLAPERSYNPMPYPLEYYLAWMRALGIQRCVQVNASCYGFDNSATGYAIEECRANSIVSRGVATIHPEIEFVQLQKLSNAGFVAARVMSSRLGGVSTAVFDELARRCVPHRWHVEVNVDSADEWVDLEPRLARSPVPVVFEHLGRMKGDPSMDSPGIRAVMRLLEKRADFALKLSAFYRLSARPEDFADVAPLVKRFAREFPERLMWGSNLPHLGWVGGAPDDLGLIALALEWLPDEQTRRKVFASNAEKFYGL